jgi:hypothetical protein
MSSPEHVDDSLRVLQQHQMGTAPMQMNSASCEGPVGFSHTSRGVLMSVSSASPSRSSSHGSYDRPALTDGPVRRLSTETKAAFKTTEFVAFLGVVAGILIAAAVTKATGGHHDVLRAAQAWLYVSIVTVGYMISRGLAKSGSKQHYDER